MFTMFKYRWLIAPIDDFRGATIASEEEHKRVLAQMPDAPRYPVVFKTYVPGDTEFIEVFICKADNNGNTYLFSDEDFVDFYSKWIRRI